MVIQPITNVENTKVDASRDYSVHIRSFSAADEQEWLECRLLAFYKTSYYDDILFAKPTYVNETIDLVAIIGKQLVGFIEIELDNHHRRACYLNGEKGGVIWNIAVHPKHQHKGIATKLLLTAVELARKKGIKRFEAWTQDDKAANMWYRRQAFERKTSYLNVYAHKIDIEKSKQLEDIIGKNYGLRSLNFEAPIKRKAELSKAYKRVHEVILYEKKFAS